VRDIAEPMGIEVRPDPEPGATCFRRSDHWPFMQRGVPAVKLPVRLRSKRRGGGALQRLVRNRYHAQDDITTPIDFERRRRSTVSICAGRGWLADADEGAGWLPNSPASAGRAN
jgi:hypothetical protein